MSPSPAAVAAPTEAPSRHTSLDLIRGVAVMGILVMNAVSFGLIDAAYDNISADGMTTWLDWAIGVAGEVFVDQKFMGLFSALFGAGIVLYADRAEAKGQRAIVMSLWRNVLLLAIGFLHYQLWAGDVLTTYALAAPLLLLLRRLQPRMLYLSGFLIMMLSPVLAAWAQSTVDTNGTDFGSFREDLFYIVDPFARAIAMMLIGVGLYRTGIFTGDRSPSFYRRLSVWGLGVGMPLSALGVVYVAANDFSPDVALVGSIPNTLATIPMVLGYIGLIVLWDARPQTFLVVRLRAAGRMALTNYLTQSMIGVAILTVLLADVDLTRSMIAVFAVGVWALQIWWSKAWLDRYRFGPAEWLWRSATNLSLQPLRQRTQETRPVDCSVANRSAPTDPGRH
ncbi:MAG: DUF418 domain-containing protein [Actinomycetia bacterium]|nr:DUF418 domain-containing protein [Actinomycetes bacterium]